MRRRLALVSPRRRKETNWFRKRNPWWRVQLDDPCDAVFTYMNHVGPRLILAGANVRCTNTLHQVQFNESVSDRQRQVAALSMVSTFGQLAAERIGRSYGGGVLKFELVNAREMPILPAVRTRHIEGSLRRADLALRSGNWDKARLIADKALLEPLLGETWAIDVLKMESELRRRRALRRGRAE